MLLKVFDVQNAFYFRDIKHEATDSMRGSSDHKVTRYGMLNVLREQIKIKGENVYVTAIKVVDVFLCMFRSKLYENGKRLVKERRGGGAHCLLCLHIENVMNVKHNVQSSYHLIFNWENDSIQ